MSRGCPVNLLMEALSIALGLSHQLAARLRPLRRQSGPPELGWDIVGMLFGILCAVLYTDWVAIPLATAVYELPELQGWYASVQTLPGVLVIIGNLLLGDLIVYWTHRFLHRAVLWHSHAWHHASRHVWWLSGLRGSPVHMVLTLLPYTLANVIFFLPGSELLIWVIVFGMLNQHWLHSNIRLPYPDLIEKVFVTPRYHFVHHSANVRLTNSNYAFVFTFWDKLFGTYTDPAHVSEDEPLGLDYENGHLRLLLGLPPQRRAQLSGEPQSTASPHANR